MIKLTKVFTFTLQSLLIHVGSDLLRARHYASGKMVAHKAWALPYNSQQHEYDARFVTVPLRTKDGGVISSEGRRAESSLIEMKFEFIIKLWLPSRRQEDIPGIDGRHRGIAQYGAFGAV